MDKFIDVLFILLGLYFSVCGIATIVTRKLYGYGKQANKYTEESVRVAAPYLGTGLLVIGVAWIVARLGAFIPALDFLNGSGRSYALIVGVVLAFPFVIVGYKKTVDKK